MTELDNLSKSGVTPNLATLHRLACTGSYSLSKLRIVADKVADRRNLLNYKIRYRPNGED